MRVESVVGSRGSPGWRTAARRCVRVDVVGCHGGLLVRDGSPVWIEPYGSKSDTIIGQLPHASTREVVSLRSSSTGAAVRSQPQFGRQFSDCRLANVGDVPFDVFAREERPPTISRLVEPALTKRAISRSRGVRSPANGSSPDRWPGGATSDAERSKKLVRRSFRRRRRHALSGVRSVAQGRDSRGPVVAGLDDAETNRPHRLDVQALAFGFCDAARAASALSAAAPLTLRTAAKARSAARSGLCASDGEISAWATSERAPAGSP